jgi:hypothetical protein
MSEFKPGTERFSSTPNGPAQTSSAKGFNRSGAVSAGAGRKDAGGVISEFSTMNKLSAF